METSFVVLTAIVAGMVEMFKRTGLPTKFCPLVSVGLGVFLSVLSDLNHWQEKVFIGLVIGLSAAGLYDNVKAPVRAALAKLGK
ncbi:MAG: holin [Chloroflexota bacterium]